MRYEEALKIIEAHDPKSDFWSTVRAAVEKQIEKDVVKEKFETIEGEYERCHCCGWSYGVTKSFNYCGVCGQRVRTDEEVE